MRKLLLIFSLFLIVTSVISCSLPTQSLRPESTETASDDKQSGGSASSGPTGAAATEPDVQTQRKTSCGEPGDPVLPAPSPEQIRENSQTVLQFKTNKTYPTIPEKLEVTHIVEKSYEQLSSECEKLAALIERERWTEELSRHEATEEAYNRTSEILYCDDAAFEKHLQAGEVIGASSPLIHASSAEIVVNWLFREYSPRFSQFCDNPDLDPETAADEDLSYAAGCFLKKYLPEYLPENDIETVVEREEDQYACVRIGKVSFEFSWNEHDLQKVSGEKIVLFRLGIYDPEWQTTECELSDVEAAFETACSARGYDAENTVVYDYDVIISEGIPFYVFLCSKEDALNTFTLTVPAVNATYRHDHYSLG